MTFFSSGDLGDIVASLPAVKALGGGDYRIGFKIDGQRESLRGDRFESIKPLLESQHYINSVAWTDDFRGVTHDFSGFRARYQLHRSLADQQAEFVGVKIDATKPWLHVTPSYHNRTVIARSSRYHNPIFPWRRIMDSVTDCLFAGLVQEHREFEAYFGQIDYQPTKNLLELAQVIAGAKQVISNQTCQWWIAAGLGVPTIQESYLADLNSVIERPNLRYSRTIQEVNQLIDSL
jgi:hypothetical protein